jgi:3-methyladenine DNA glycosylase Tag
MFLQFIKNNSKIQVTNNINADLTKELKNFKQAVVAKDFSEATAQYAKVLNDCVSCHTIIRGW